MCTTLSSFARGLGLVTLLVAGPSAGGAAPDVRELSTDRPDVTESPISVPRGWMQLELDAAAWSIDEVDHDKTTRLSTGVCNLKYGLARTMDLQLVFEPMVLTRTDTDGSNNSTTTSSGEAQVRFKWNLAGNDGGRFAAGLLPWVAWNTAARGTGLADAAGLAVPVGFAATDRIGLGAMLEGSIAEDAHAFLGTTTAGADLGRSVGIFAEVTGERIVTDGADATLATFNSGLTYAPVPDFQFDGGVRIGLTGGADDRAYFVGLAYRRPLR